MAPPAVVWVLLHPSDLRFTLRQMSLSSWPNETDVNMERVEPLEVVNLPLLLYRLCRLLYASVRIAVKKRASVLTQSKTKVQYAETALIAHRY
jgi:hypothetical protein